MRRAFDWTFRSRKTGRVVIAQWPNVPLWVFIVAAIARRVFDPTGTARTVLTAVGTTALLVWAADELIRGEAPFRRVLGAVIAGATLARLLL